MTKERFTIMRKQMHEIRESLCIIVGAEQALRETGVEKDEIGCLNMIAARADSIVKLLDQVSETGES